MNKFSNLLNTIDKDELINYYSNHSRTSTAKQFNISTYHVDLLLDAYGVKKHTRTESTRLYNLEMYGVENVSQSSEIVDKIKATKKARYGDENYCNLEQRKRTNLEKYGSVSAFGNPEVQEKSRQTNLARYGVENAFLRSDIQAELKARESEIAAKRNAAVRKTFLEKYGVENPSQLKGSREKALESMRQTMREKYGLEYPVQLPQVRQAMGGRSSNSVPNKAFAELLAYNGIECQPEFTIGRFTYDFRVGQTVVEIDPAATHNSTWTPFSKTGKSKTYHYDKSQEAVSHGYRCIHIWDWDNTESILELLKNNRKKIYARQCSVSLVDTRECKSFLNDYHLQGYIKADICLALMYEGEIAALMTFSKPRYNRNYQFELLRYCSKYNIVGGAEKLFKHFVGSYDPQSIISYCDLSKFTGDVYPRLGFKFKSYSIGKHWYNIKTKKHITNNLLIQRGFDQLLGKEYGCYGKGTPNEELMLQHGFVEIYDAGQATYIWKKKKIIENRSTTIGVAPVRDQVISKDCAS